VANIGSGETTQENAPQKVLLSTGIDGLDNILGGGLQQGRVHVLEGDPGAGKTTMAMHFMLEGARQKEPCLFVSLSETEYELRAFAASHGWNVDGIEILEIIPSEGSLTPDSRYTMYHPSEVELGETTKAVLSEAKRIKPKRLVFDSLSGLRALAESPLRYRRQILALKQHFATQGCTILFVDDRASLELDVHLHSIASGVLVLESLAAEYGSLRRRIHVKKMRGSSFRDGYHDFVIREGGLEVFPRLVAAEHYADKSPTLVQSGIPELDELLGGGLTRGTSTLLIGPAGSGKSAMATQYAVTAALRGERCAMYVFDESLDTAIERSRGLGLELGDLIKERRILARQVDPAELSAGEFSHAVRQSVEVDGVALVVIDSLTGYLNAMPSERFLTLHLHELLRYLGQRGVTVLMLLTQHGVMGEQQRAAVDTSYLADAVVLLRYFEAVGEVRQAVSVIKKRTGWHERTIRELRLDRGIKVGPAIRDFHGVLSGTPDLLGQLHRVSGGA
jgi:circadian clock protein KaiC